MTEQQAKAISEVVLSRLEDMSTDPRWPEGVSQDAVFVQAKMLDDEYVEALPPNFQYYVVLDDTI